MYDQDFDLHHHTTDRYHNAEATHRRLHPDGAYCRHILHNIRRDPLAVPTCGSQLGYQHRIGGPWRVLASKLNVGAVIYFNRQHHRYRPCLCGPPGYHSLADTNEALDKDYDLFRSFFRLFVSILPSAPTGDDLDS